MITRQQTESLHDFMLISVYVCAARVCVRPCYHCAADGHYMVKGGGLVEERLGGDRIEVPIGHKRGGETKSTGLLSSKEHGIISKCIKQTQSYSSRHMTTRAYGVNIS